MVAYATTGAKGEFDEGRRRRVCAWTMEALKESGDEDWASVFRFASVDRDTIYDAGIFDGAVWYMPDSKKPRSLLGSKGYTKKGIIPIVCELWLVSHCTHVDGSIHLLS